MSPRRTRRLLLQLAFLPSVVCGCDCAHRRQALYPGGVGSPVSVETNRGVRVRAPFVDVQVPTSDPAPPVMLGD